MIHILALLSATFYAFHVQALPTRNDLVEESPYYNGLMREAAFEDKETRNLDGIDVTFPKGQSEVMQQFLDNLIEAKEVARDGRKKPQQESSGGNLLRELEAALRSRSNLGRQMRNLDSLSGATFGSNKRFIDSLSGQSLGASKRNMDEIDRSGFNSFIKKKKNFDEIDRSGFDGFVKRSASE